MILDNRGYQTVVEHFLDLAGAYNGKLKLNAMVTKVQYRGSGVMVTLADGTTYTGKAVLSTVSVGVLKASVARMENSIEFIPPLPQRKRRALRRMGMAAFTKFFIQFNKPIVMPERAFFTTPADCQRRMAIFNLNRKEFLPGQNVVFVAFVSSTSRWWSTKSDRATLRQALSAVSKVIGRIVTEGDVKAFVQNKFQNDPRFRGVWSTKKVGFTSQMSIDLAKPEGRLFFAGEGVFKPTFRTATQVGTVKAAWTTGDIAAKQILRFFSKN